MSIGIALPAGPDLGANVVDTLVGLVAEAHELGLASAWFSQRYDHDALSLAAVAGARVPGIAIGTSVVPVYPRHPIVVAAQAQTAQAASHGRFTLGLGLGVPDTTARNFGVDTGRPIRHLREYLTALNSILDTGEADVRGETLTARTPWPVPVPGASPRLPVLVAAMGEQALRVTGELADGTLPFLAGPRTLAEFIVPTIAAAAEKAGRPTPRIVAAVPAVVTDDVKRLRETARQQLEFYLTVPSYRTILEREGVEHPSELFVIGDEDHLAEQVSRYREAGATEVVLSQTALAGEDDRRRTWTAAGKLDE